MSKKNISQEKIIQAFISCAFEKSAGATSLADIADSLEIKKASLYNHFENRDSMYNASIEYCGRELGAVNFLPEHLMEMIDRDNTVLSDLLERLVTRFFELYENSPLFEMYSFIHTEQYFNLGALKIVEEENNLIVEDIFKALSMFEGSGELIGKAERDIKNIAKVIGAIIIQKRDYHIASRKEIVRQNPDSGVGSLFALPADESSVKETIDIIENYLKIL